MCKFKLISFFAILLVVLSCTNKVGRVAVILDNSSSMTVAGTPFEDIKRTLLDALTLVPHPYQVGLRVFQINNSGSFLVAPYYHDLSVLRSALSNISPQTGTYIGQNLYDAVSDLLEVPNGDNHLIMVTDGEGYPDDVSFDR